MWYREHMQADHDSISAYSDVWRAVEARVGFAVPRVAKAYLGQLDLPAGVLQAERDREPETVEDLLTDMATHLQALVEVGLIERHAPVSAEPIDSGQWKLVADLLARHAESTGREPAERWAPIEVGADSSFMVHGLPGFGGWRVIARFDGRLSFRALTTELRKMWPELRRRGLVSRTRGPAPRGLAVIRLVCLEGSREDSWRDRWQQWEQRYGDRWHFKDQRAFNSAFHRAEFELTRRTGGLAYLYDKKVFEQDLRFAETSLRDVLDLARAHDPGALAALQRNMKQVAEGLTDAGKRRGILPSNGGDRPPD